MNARHVVALSLLWTGALVILSRRWLGDVREYVRRAAGRVADAASSTTAIAPPPAQEGPVIGPRDPGKWTPPGPGATFVALGASLTYAVWQMANGAVLYAAPDGSVIGVEKYAPAGGR